MQRIDYWFVIAGVLYGVFGMGFGIWMGITESLNYTNTHAHINLVGFVSFVLFGIVYRLWPELKIRRLAVAHFALAMVGAPLLLIGKAMIDTNGLANAPVKIGSLLVVAGMLAFIGNLATVGRARVGGALPALAE